MSEFEDDITITAETLDADVPDGFTLKGRIFQLETDTVFYNDEDNVTGYRLISEDGDGYEIGFDEEQWPTTPTLAEALYGVLGEQAFGGTEVLPESAFTPEELRLIYESCIRRNDMYANLAMNRANRFQQFTGTLTEKLATLPKDHLTELQARFGV